MNLSVYTEVHEKLDLLSSIFTVTSCHLLDVVAKIVVSLHPKDYVPGNTLMQEMPPQTENTPSHSTPTSQTATGNHGNVNQAGGNISTVHTERTTVQTKRTTLAISITMLFLVVLGAAGIRLAFPGGSLQLNQPTSAATKN
jgi:hypothetical protein